KEGSERLIRAAIRYAIENSRKSVTLVHKGNIQKYTEGMFMKWGYALAKREFGDRTVSWDESGGRPPAGRILIKDAITDAFLQQILTRPDELMLRYLGWADAADRIIAALEKTIQSKVVTYDFARLMEGAREVKCSEFGTAIIQNMAKP